MINKRRYDKLLEMRIAEAKIKKDAKAVFILGMELDAWLGHDGK